MEGRRVKRSIGLYNLNLRARGGGEKLTLVMAEHLSLSHQVRLFCLDPRDVSTLESYFGVNLSRVQVVRLRPPGLRMRLLGKMTGRHERAFLLQHFLQIRKLKLDLFVNSSYASGLACPAARGLLVCMFPHRPSAVEPRGGALEAVADHVEKRLTGFDAREAAASYTAVAAISRYSAEWIGKLWGRRSEIVYPPCDDMGPPAAAKRKVILHVGRFNADVGREEIHHKGQGLLLETFRGMTELHREGWELHLAGSVGAGEESAAFAARLTESARGLPVTFHFDAPLAELRELYRRAAVYWHATGYGFPVEEHPARQEHFGITTVEAMSAGTVPVVYGTGGQREVVTDGEDGFCWNETAELASRTALLANDTKLRERMARRAVASSRRFGREAFAASVKNLVERLLDGGA